MTETFKGTYEVALKDLRTIQRAPLGGSTRFGDITTAHPARLPDGSIYNIAVDVRLAGHAVPAPY